MTTVGNRVTIVSFSSQPVLAHPYLIHHQYDCSVYVVVLKKRYQTLLQSLRSSQCPLMIIVVLKYTQLLKDSSWNGYTFIHGGSRGFLPLLLKMALGRKMQEIENYCCTVYSSSFFIPASALLPHVGSGPVSYTCFCPFPPTWNE